MNYEIHEVDFSYRDSIFGQVRYGNYEPTGIIILNDGSIVISTKFSIDFPEQFQQTDSYTKEYFKMQKEYSEKSHISSGSVFMLDANFEKKWGVIFKERRVTHVRKLQDETIIVLGESTDMKFFWIAKVDKEGSVVFEKRYRFKSSPSIANVEVDSLDNLYILVTTEKILPIKITNHLSKRRIRFFKETTMESDVYILKVSPTGKIKWKTSIDTRRNYFSFGQAVVINKNIYISNYTEGYKREKTGWVEEAGNYIYTLNSRGKIKEIFQTKNKNILSLNKQIIYSTHTDNDSLVLYKKVFSSLKPFVTIVFNNKIKQFSIDKALSTDLNNYIFGTTNHNLGCLLIELNSENKYNGYWSYDNSNFVDAAIDSNKSIYILAKNYSNLNPNNSDNENFSVKLIKIKR